MTAVLPEYLSVEAWAFEAELNSLAAGASRIEVDIEDGGISLIRVRDDGYGMLPDDAERAVAEHATSKIRTAEDLARVESLGFRGEALHAIGSVSHLTLTTNAPGAGSPGFRVVVLAGETVEAGPASHPPGTTVEARELFRNLPMRRSFLGTVRAEMHAGRDNGPLRMRLGLRTAAQSLWRGARRRASTP